jgi:hypothetical protein
MIALFYYEILEEDKDVREDFTLKGFGSGVAYLACKVSMRIRRRVKGRI